MKINNKLVVVLTLIILVIAIGWKVYKDNNSDNRINENIAESVNQNITDSNNVSNNIENNSEKESSTSNAKERIIDVTNAEFEEKVINSDKIVIVDFWADWCGPCAYMSPILEEIVNEREDIIIAKVDVDVETELSTKYSITAIPTMLVFKNGEMKEELVGIMKKETLLKYVDNIK